MDNRYNLVGAELTEVAKQVGMTIEQTVMRYEEFSRQTLALLQKEGSSNRPNDAELALMYASAERHTTSPTTRSLVAISSLVNIARGRLEAIASDN